LPSGSVKSAIRAPQSASSWGLVKATPFTFRACSIHIVHQEVHARLSGACSLPQSNPEVILGRPVKPKAYRYLGLCTIDTCSCTFWRNRIGAVILGKTSRDPPEPLITMEP